MTLKQKIDQLVKDLESNKRIELVHLNWKPGKQNNAKDPGIVFINKTIRSLYNEEIPLDFISSMDVCNNTHICWRGQFEGKTYWGEIKWADVTAMYKDLDLNNSMYMGAGTMPDYSKFSEIDSHPEIGDVHAVYYNRTDGRLYFNYQYNLYPLTINYREYLEQAITNRGAGMWPFLFVNPAYLKDEYTKQKVHDYFVNYTAATNFFNQQV
jgi:hypothetical protein